VFCCFILPYANGLFATGDSLPVAFPLAFGYLEEPLNFRTMTKDNRKFSPVWRFTTINHPVRIALGITPNEYCVFDVIYQSQTHPEHSRDGWAVNSYGQIAAFFGFSKSTVAGIIERGVNYGLIEVDPANPERKKTLPNWYNFAYLKTTEGVEVPSVRKPNATRSETERNRSETERNRSETERHKEYKLNTTKEEVKVNMSNGDKSPSVTDKKTEDAKALIGLLNELTGRQFSDAVSGRGSSNVRWLKSLLKDYTREEIALLIEYKVWQWKGNAKMEPYLRPSTLFKHHGKEYAEEALEARDNPEFQKILKASKKAEKPGHGIVAGVVTNNYVNALSNW